MTENVPALPDWRVSELALDDEHRNAVAQSIVDAIPAEELHTATVYADAVRATLAKIVAGLEARLSREVGDAHYWTAPDGTEYRFAGTRSWEVPDPEGLRAALVDAGVDPVVVGRIFRTKLEVLHTDLNAIVKSQPRSDAAEAIYDHREAKYGPPHLKKVER